MEYATEHGWLSLARARPRLAVLDHRRLLVIVLFLAVASFDLARATDMDFWWHVKTGELIAHSGSVPASDPFSYTALGRPWVVHEWLWELATFLIYRHGGYLAAVLVSVAIVTVTYVLLYRLLRQLGANEILSAALVLWAAALALPNLGVRPRELTFLFLAFYLSRLLLYREGRIARLRSLPVVMVLWVNLHGGFMLGLGLLALFVIGGMLDWFLSKVSTNGERAFRDDPEEMAPPADEASASAASPSLPRQSPSRGEFPRHMLLVGIATLAAATLNPAGPRMLWYPFSYYGQGENPSFRIVVEFGSPNFHEPLLLLFAAGIIAFMALGVRRGQWLDGLLVAVFTVQALVSTRQVAVCALVMAPLLALVLCERFRWARELAPPRLPPQLIAVNWALLAILILGGVAYAARPNVSAKLQLGSEPKPSDMPVAGARFIADRRLPGPVFNHQPWGGYLIYRWYPGRRVFIDGRIDMYGPDIVGDYVKIANIQPGWSEALEKYGVRTVLIPKDSPLSLMLLGDHRWARVFQGDIEDVFVRREDKREPLPSG
jgi:hypothetical protein